MSLLFLKFLSVTFAFPHHLSLFITYILFFLFKLILPLLSILHFYHSVHFYIFQEDCSTLKCLWLCILRSPGKLKSPHGIGSLNKRFPGIWIESMCVAWNFFKRECYTTMKNDRAKNFETVWKLLICYIQKTIQNAKLYCSRMITVFLSQQKWTENLEGNSSLKFIAIFFK